jgi:hypothetical protein
MPVRSLSSSVLKWPDAQTVDQAVRHWTERIVQSRKGVLQIGYFGSYARGDWGVSVEWDTRELPVPADVLIYTEREWRSLSLQRRFSQTLRREAVWVYVREKAGP